MIVLVCGDRNWTNLKVMLREMEKLPKNCTIVHGNARGADKMSGFIGAELGMKVMSVSAEWEKYGRAAGPIRNRKMFNEYDPDLVLAFHEDLSQSKGTKDMVNYARKNGCNVKIIDK